MMFWGQKDKCQGHKTKQMRHDVRPCKIYENVCAIKNLHM